MKFNDLWLVGKDLLQMPYNNPYVNVSIPAALHTAKRQLRASRTPFEESVIQTLHKYKIKADNLKCIGNSHNVVYQVQTKKTKYALRIQSSQKRETSEIIAELEWLSMLRSEMSLTVPEAIPSADGKLVQEVAIPNENKTLHIVLFKWIDGESLEKNLSPSSIELAGEFMAQLHQHALKISSKNLHRKQTDWTRLQHWSEKKTCPKVLTSKGYELCLSIAEDLQTKSAQFNNKKEYGLIHKDLHLENFLLSHGNIAAIDFDSCEYGPFLYDIAVTFLAINNHSNAGNLKKQFAKGYSQVCPLPTNFETALEIITAARALSIASWIIDKRCSYSKSFALKNLAQLLEILSQYRSQMT